MNFRLGMVLAISILLFACQPSSPVTATIIDNGKVFTLQTDERIPLALFTEAGMELKQGDRILSEGHPIPLEEPISNGHVVLQLRRTMKLTLETPNGQEQIQSSAFSVGEALADVSYWLRAGDEIEPPLNSPIADGMTITISSPHTLTVRADGKVVKIQSSARTVGEALAEAGIPLLGLDYSLPSENDPPPVDGQIKVMRVNESVILAQKPIPFESELIAAAEVPLDQTQILSPGENGLSVQRIRIRYEDGNEISRITEDETMVRPPKTRTLGYGTKVEINTATVNGVKIEYWRAVQMYATSYSPCRLGTSTCGSTTASGKQLQKGVVALPTNLYLSMKGQALFSPGYGFATVEDACGGCVGKPWIDLGYSDNDYEPWFSSVTVYFLTPVPQNIVYTLE
jgi:uncharacterized protein YabE (DUF348 family)